VQSYSTFQVEVYYVHVGFCGLSPLPYTEKTRCYNVSMPFYIYAWIASFFSGLIILVTKLTSKYSIKNPWLFNFLWSLIIFLFTLPPAIANHAGMPKEWWSIIVAALFGTIWYIFYIFAIYRLDVSTLSPLFNFRTLFAVFLGVLLVHEQLTLNQLIYFIAVLVAGMFATIDEKFTLKSFFVPAIMIGLSAMLFLALNNVFIKIALEHNDLWTANLWMSIISVILLIPTIAFFYKEIFKISITQILPVGAMGIFQTITNFSANTAYGVNVGITSLIMAAPLSMVLIWILAIFAPNLLEKHTHKVYAIRFTAAIVMIYSALKLSA
jgi:drug/metabolite transporter (DMT)-like permease